MSSKAQSRLSAATLAGLPAPVARPSYDRNAVRTGIVHLGVGAFHRAHQAVYTEDVLETGDLRWGIAAASLRSPDTHDALAPQDGLYTVLTRGAEDRLRVIGALQSLIVAPNHPGALLDRMCDPAVAIVSLTVTEKGYCHDPATGTLNEAHPAIQEDLRNPRTPRSTIGILAAAIARRRAEGTPPFTVLCCDNLPSNGRVVHRVLTRYATLVSPDLGAFVRDEIACPETMVDRIVPATTNDDRAAVATALGVTDAWPVVAEPFSQWVIQDRFSGSRPAWENFGAELVAEVAPYEAMKLRMLNGSHSAIAYLGALAGLETVADVIRLPAFAAYIEALMDDSAETLALPPGADAAGYKRALIERFRNPGLRHRTLQIAMDGSQKLPQRLLGTVRERLAAGRPIERHALAIAAWMRFVAGRDEAGRALELRDPLADTLAAAARRGDTPEDLVRSLVSLPAVFGDDLAGDRRFTDAVTGAVRLLAEHGARGAAERCAAGRPAG